METNLIVEIIISFLFFLFFGICLIFVLDTNNKKNRPTKP